LHHNLLCEEKEDNTLLFKPEIKHCRSGRKSKSLSCAVGCSPSRYLLRDLSNKTLNIRCVRKRDSRKACSSSVIFDRLSISLSTSNGVWVKIGVVDIGLH
jgi:hypothetical protein